MSYVETARSTCALGGALSLIHSIEKAVPIIHAGPGCGSVLNFGQNLASGYQFIGYASGSASPSTNTLEKHVIFGGENRLREQIKSTLELVDADLYFVVSGCTAGLIGDDIRSVVSEFSGNSETVIFSEAPGFKGSTYQGYEIAYKSLIDQVIQPVTRKEKNTVNLLGIVPAQDPFWQGNISEIVRLLGRIGLKVNLSGDGDTVKKIRKAAGVDLNILLSANTGISAAKHFKEKFDVSYIQYPLPIGTETGKFLREIANTLGLDKQKVNKVIEEEEKYLWKYLIKFSEAYAFILVNKEFGIIGDTNYVIGMTRFLTNDLGLHPKLAVVTDAPSESIRDTIKESITNLNYDLSPGVIFESDAYKIWDEVSKNPPDLLIGSSADKPAAQKLNIPLLATSYPLYDRIALSKGYSGYRGSINLVEDIGDVLLSTM
ncbi:MAG: hypothetical protein C3F06_14050 [Candidatus Methanoperedenaceae archaeon]|nr:MAG: hypothetical protein C3F06_14050 [Candidatus Methanoperedenaceae archaeon]